MPFVLRYVPDPHNNEGMCDEVILENDGMLKFVPDCYNKAVDTCSSALQVVPDRYKTQEISDKAVDTCSFP